MSRVVRDRKKVKEKGSSVWTGQDKTSQESSQRGMVTGKNKKGNGQWMLDAMLYAHPCRMSLFTKFVTCNELNTLNG